MFESDGPNHYNNFIGMKTLNAEANLKEILRWLRFFKGEDNYQTLLNHYLPMLPEEHFTELIEDVEFFGEDEKVDKKKTTERVAEITAKWEERHISPEDKAAAEERAKVKAEKEAAKLKAAEERAAKEEAEKKAKEEAEKAAAKANKSK